MMLNKLTFQSENLVIDYISFNIPGSDNTESIAKYLFEKFNFNSNFAKGQNGTTYDWFYLNRNQHQVSFRELEYDPSSKSFWEGTIIHFSGTNAAQFYKIIQAHKFDWNIFKLKNASLGRVDIHYFRQSEVTDQEYQIEHFMEKSCQRIRDKSKRRKAHWGRESNALVLRIGNRSSSNYYRVYQKYNGLQFDSSVMYNTILKYKENKNRNITIMNQEKMEQLNLQSQKLTIDYFSFNIPGSLQKDYLRKVALYLFESFGFNATFKREQLDQKQTFFSSDKNSHEVNFVHYDYNPKVKSFWEGTKVNFTGDNAKYFYNQIKNNQLDRNIFDLTKLTFARIDVNSLRESKITDTNQSIEDFMELSRRRVVTKDKRRKASWEYEETGLVLRVGKRGNSRYYRVYQIDTDHNFKRLKFEFEFKPSRLLKELFMDNSIQHFEHELIKEYYSYSFRSVTLSSPYSDWLLYWYRKFSQKPNLNGFITTYFKQELTDNKELIFNYFRTLSYIHKHGKKQQKFQINDQQQTFYEVTFRLIDFIRYVKGNEKNHRQRNRMVEIFKKFQDLHQFQLKTFQTILDDNLILNDNFQFTSVVLIPYFSIKKKGNIWNVTLLIASQFYDYNFPFQFNHYFLHWKNIQHFEVQTQVIQILGQTTIKKKLDVKQFMKPFEKVSNVKKTTVKRILIESIDQEIQNKFLQPKFRIVQKDNSIKYLDQIKPINITKAKFIYFYENINIRDLLKQI